MEVELLSYASSILLFAVHLDDSIDLCRPSEAKDEIVVIVNELAEASCPP